MHLGRKFQELGERISHEAFVLLVEFSAAKGVDSRHKVARFLYSGLPPNGIDGVASGAVGEAIAHGGNELVSHADEKCGVGVHHGVELGRFLEDAVVVEREDGKRMSNMARRTPVVGHIESPFSHIEIARAVEPIAAEGKLG